MSKTSKEKTFSLISHDFPLSSAFLHSAIVLLLVNCQKTLLHQLNMIDRCCFTIHQPRGRLSRGWKILADSLLPSVVVGVILLAHLPRVQDSRLLLSRDCPSMTGRTGLTHAGTTPAQWKLTPSQDTPRIT